MTDTRKKPTGFTPTAQMAIFWRVLNLIIGSYGNYPAGQVLVALTMVFLHDRDMNPTLTDLCKATGLPKATVSRYVSWQLSEGLAEEAIDPNDRRRRVLMRTDKGREAMRWQRDQMRELFKEAGKLDAAFRVEGGHVDAEDMLASMKRLTIQHRALKRG